MQAKVANILNSGGYLKQNLSALQSQINLSIDSIRRLMSDKFEDVEEESDEEYFPVEEQTSDELDEVSPEEFFMETKKASADAFKFGERECIICGKKFNAIPSTKKYCSNECRDVLNHLKYAKYLKPPERILKEKLIEKGFLK
jgi:hypothetical protein